MKMNPNNNMNAYKQALQINRDLKKENDRKVLNIGGNFSLIDQNGDIYESKIIQKKKLIYFGYTFCPDICPFDILKLSNLLIDGNASAIGQIFMNLINNSLKYNDREKIIIDIDPAFIRFM